MGLARRIALRSRFLLGFQQLLDVPQQIRKMRFQRTFESVNQALFPEKIGKVIGGLNRLNSECKQWKLKMGSGFKLLTDLCRAVRLLAQNQQKDPRVPNRFTTATGRGF